MKNTEIISFMLTASIVGVVVGNSNDYVTFLLWTRDTNYRYLIRDAYVKEGCYDDSPNVCIDISVVNSFEFYVNHSLVFGAVAEDWCFCSVEGGYSIYAQNRIVDKLVKPVKIAQIYFEIPYFEHNYLYVQTYESLTGFQCDSTSINPSGPGGMVTMHCYEL